MTKFLEISSKASTYGNIAAVEQMVCMKKSMPGINYLLEIPGQGDEKISLVGLFRAICSSLAVTTSKRETNNSISTETSNHECQFSYSSLLLTHAKLPGNSNTQ